MIISPSAENKLRVRAAHFYAVVQSPALDSWCVVTSGTSDLRCFQTNAEAITDRDTLVEAKFQEFLAKYESEPSTGNPFPDNGNPVVDFSEPEPAPQVFRKTKRPVL